MNMAPLRSPPILPCLVILLFSIFLPSKISFSCSNNNNYLKPPTNKGITLSLIPPTNPNSPFYNQLLQANNISSTTVANTTIGRAHYREWRLKAMSTLLLKENYQSKYSEISLHKVAGYAMDMFIGDPVQYVFGTLDTGSELIWFQCEGQKGSKFPSFNQSKSSSYKQILCGDEKRCDTNVDEIVCDHYEEPCGFKAEYLDDTYANGIMATDKASLSSGTEFLPELKFGCRTNNSRDVMGIIGAGIGEYSLPLQLYPNDPKFSYCISYDISKTNLVKFGPEADLSGLSMEVYRNKDYPFYYLDVLSIQVNGIDTDVPPYVYEMSPDGTRGFIIDSGTAITSLTGVAFDALKKRLEELLGPPTHYWLFDICYPPSRFAKRKLKRRPSISIHFPDFKFVLPRTGTWEDMRKAKLVCLLIQRTDSLVSTLGYEQLFDVNVGHDVKNNRLHLLRTKCATADDT